MLLLVFILCFPEIVTTYEATQVNKTFDDNKDKALLTLLKQQPLAEINISMPLLTLYKDKKPLNQKPNINDQPILGLELFPKHEKFSKLVPSVKLVTTTNKNENFGYQSTLNHSRLPVNASEAILNPFYHPKLPLANVTTPRNVNRTANNMLESDNDSRIIQTFGTDSGTPLQRKFFPTSIVSTAKENNTFNVDKRNSSYLEETARSEGNGTSKLTKQDGVIKETGFKNIYATNNVFPKEKNYVSKAPDNSSLAESINNNVRNMTKSMKVHNLSNHRKVVESKMTSADQDWCNETSMDSIACREKINKGPRQGTSEFSGNIGIKHTDQNESRILGGETSNAYNETMNFKAGKSTYNFQNLTNFHNCSGCLKDKHLIHLNKTTGKAKPKVETSEENLGDGLSDISKLRAKLLGDRENFLVRNMSRNANKTDPLKQWHLINSEINKNSTKPGNNQTLKSKDQKSNFTSDKVQTRGVILQRRCEEVDTKRNKVGKSINLNEIITNCVTKRRLVSTKHTKTKKNGKVIGEKDEGGKSLQNAERAQANEENAKSNNERKNQSKQNDKDNSKLKLSNEKILQDILRGDDGKPSHVNKQVEHDHDFQNITMKLDPTIIQHRLHPEEEKVPDENHLDEDVGMMGIDERPAIEDIEDPPKLNKTEHNVANKTEKLKAPKVNVTTILNDKGNNETLAFLRNITQFVNKENNETEKTANEVSSALQSNDTATENPVPSNITVDKQTASEKQSKRILAFGDSLTKGFYRSGSLDKPQYNPYKNRLSELLENGDPTKQYTIFEEGVNGECACGAMAKRLPIVLNEKKDVNLVIIMAGTNDLMKNDCIRKCDLFEAITKLHDITKKRRIKSVVTTILVSRYPTSLQMTPKETIETLFEVNQKLRGYGKQQETTKQMKFCDIADEFSRKATISFDKIHPNAKGYDVLAEILYTCIKDFRF